jgi:hypothetical protein
MVLNQSFLRGWASNVDFFRSLFRRWFWAPVFYHRLFAADFAGMRPATLAASILRPIPLFSARFLLHPVTR